MQFRSEKRRRIYTSYGWISPTHMDLCHPIWCRKPWISSEGVEETILRYNDQLHMRFSTKDYVTSWQPLEVGIPMRCTISPLLFVMAIEMIVRGAEKTADETKSFGGSILPPVKAFMNGITCLVRSSKSTSSLLQSLAKLIKWARMKFKAAKSRSMSLPKGRRCLQNVSPSIIPTLQE